MEPNNLIPVEIFCLNHHIEISFIDSLQNAGLLELSRTEETAFIPLERMSELEKLVRLHYELEINMEGLEAISHLLQRIKSMDEEMRNLKNKLRLLEPTEDTI